MQPQAPISRVPTIIPTVKPISAPRVATITESNRKPTTLTTESSKCDHQCKQQASQLCNAVPPTSPTTRIGAWAQVATAAAQAAPLCSNTHSHMRHSGVQPPTRQPGHAAAVMKQQRQQSGRTCTTHTPHHQTGKRSTSSNCSHGQGHRQAPKLQTANEQPKIQKSMKPVSSQQIQATSKWHWRAHQKPHQHYQVHLQTQDTRKPQKRRHIQAICMLGQTQKGRTQPNALHGRWQQNQLPRRSSHPNRRNASGKNALQ